MLNPLNRDQILKNICHQSSQVKSKYHGLFSSWHGGLIVDQDLMMIPVDDHLVHRGDGVFEAIKVINKKPYLLEDHLQRLLKSAQFLKLPLPYPLEKIEKIIFECFEVLNLPLYSLVRIFVSRGPGDFSVNPQSTIGSQIYIVFTDCATYTEDQREKGFVIGFGDTPAKETWMAPYKTCNYIQNVLLKGEAISKGWDFAVAKNANGFMSESSTENIFWLNQKNELCFPHLNSILQGTVMARALKLAKKELGFSVLQSEMQFLDLPKQLEIFVAGTTLDVLRVRQIGDAHLKIPDYSNSVAKKLFELISNDQKI